MRTLWWKALLVAGSTMMMGCNVERLGDWLTQQGVDPSSLLDQLLSLLGGGA